MIIGLTGKIGSGKDTVAEIIQFLFSEEAKEGKEFPKINKPLPRGDGEMYSFEYFSPFTHVKFASYLKTVVTEIINCKYSDLENPEFKEKPLDESWWKWVLKPDGGYKNIVLPYIGNEIPPKEYEGLELIKTTPRMLMETLGTDWGRDMVHPNIWVNRLLNWYKNQNETFFKVNLVISDVRFDNEAEAIFKMENSFIFEIVGREGKQSPHLSNKGISSKYVSGIINNSGSMKELVEEVKNTLEKFNCFNNYEKR